MAKHSYELKIQVVKDYLDGLGGYLTLSKRYQIAAKHLSQWVALYQAHGAEALKKRYSQHSTEFKLEVLGCMDSQAWSPQQTAAHFNIPSPSTIRDWRRLYNQGGALALEPKPKGRSPMTKQTDYKALLSKPVAELTHEELLKRLEYLEVENAYLKKLEALAQRKNLANKTKPK